MWTAEFWRILGNSHKKLTEYVQAGYIESKKGHTDCVANAVPYVL